MVKSEFVKEGAVVVDVGINVDESGKLCGDVDTDDVLDKVSMITPVPAGVGSVTTSILAVVVDVGINVDESGKLCGDVDTDDVLDKVSMITPVPAGVGSVTTSILAKHVVKACKLQNNKL